jgi:hypothetical protein
LIEETLECFLNLTPEAGSFPSPSSYVLTQRPGLLIFLQKSITVGFGYSHNQLVPYHSPLNVLFYPCVFLMGEDLLSIATTYWFRERIKTGLTYSQITYGTYSATLPWVAVV